MLLWFPAKGDEIESFLSISRSIGLLSTLTSPLSLSLYLVSLHPPQCLVMF